MSYAIIASGGTRAGQRDRTKLAWVTKVDADGSFMAHTASLSSLPTPTWTKRPTRYRANQMLKMFGKSVQPTTAEIKAVRLAQKPRETHAESVARYA